MSESMDFNMQKNMLLDLAKAGTLSHAMIIECDDVPEALDFFMNVVKIKLCTGANKPCSKCGNCIKMKSNSHPDVKIIGATGKNKSIKIDDIRSIREDAYIISGEGSDKFYIIENADYMTAQAQNALIKILEEPPKNVIFALICSSSVNLLSTIRSRAHIFKIQSDSKSEENEMLLISKQIVEASLDGRNDKILKYLSDFGVDRKKFKSLIENIIESFIECFKSENIDKDLADNLAFKIDKLRNLMNLADKNVNMNLLVAIVCSCL